LESNEEGGYLLGTEVTKVIKLVRCVDNGYLSCDSLTVGKEYNVLGVDGEFYRITNDTGETLWYCTYRFEDVMESEEALRYDSGKPRFDLIPGDAMFALATAFTNGSKVYPERNWEKGMPWGKCFGALMRHAWKFWIGEDIDKETGSPHIILAAWNCIALYCYYNRNIGVDDRVQIRTQ
jgi:hypothetical protein